MKRSKRTALPRVTVLAMSRKELVAFSSAVNDIRTLKLELAAVVEELAALVKVKAAKRKPSRAAAVGGVLADQVDEKEGGNGQA